VWRRPAGLVAVSAADRLVLVVSPRAVTGVDPATGAERWSVPGAGFTAAGRADDYPRWFVTTGSGRLRAYDARTGALTATVATAEGLPGAVGDLLLVEHGAAGLTAYHLPDLTRLWFSDVDLSQSWTQTSCGAVICAFRPQRGVTALDPATGRQLWTAERWTFAEPAGPYLIATVLNHGPGEPQQWILDAATGRVTGDFGPWQALGAGPSPGLLYGKRDNPGGGYVVWYGVLDPRTGRASILGAAQRVSVDCEVTADVLICRLVDASVAVWNLR
jgi:outer membrane protein assembly factor BamB